MFRPLLWNLFFDEVLRLSYTGDVTSIDFADNLEIVIEADQWS